MPSSLSLSLLFLLSSVFYISIIESSISVWVLFTFSSSSLKCSLCRSILFHNSVSSFITNALNSSVNCLFLFHYLLFQGFLLLFPLRVVSLIFILLNFLSLYDFM